MSTFATFHDDAEAMPEVLWAYEKPNGGFLIMLKNAWMLAVSPPFPPTGGASVRLSHASHTRERRVLWNGSPTLSGQTADSLLSLVRMVATEGVLKP